MSALVPAGIVSVGLAAAAAGAWTGRCAPASRRLGRLRGEVEQSRRRQVTDRGVRGRTVAAIGGGAAVAAFVGLPWGALPGAVAAIALVIVLGRIEPARVRRRRERLAADLPVAVDLLGACLRSGSTPADATDAVARAVGGPLGEALFGVVALLRLGGDPAGSWGTLTRDPELAPLSRAVARAVATGAPLAVALEQIGSDARDARRAAIEAAARKVGVRSAAPLGLCFLPAFVLLGVVPVVAGIAQNIVLW